MQSPNSNLGFYQPTSPIDWYGTGSGTPVSPTVPNVNLPGSASFTQPNAFGFRWIMATATTPGRMDSYLNRVKVGPTITWNQYSAANAPPPVLGTSAFSLLDTTRQALIIGTNTASPMTVYSVKVWQGAGANNLIL